MKDVIERLITRTQVLELGPQDLEPLHHDPHCILVVSLLMRRQLMRIQRGCNEDHDAEVQDLADLILALAF